MKAGVHVIISKIHEDAQQHGSERYTQTKDAIDGQIDVENAVYQEESDKERDVLKKHNEHEYARRLEYQRSRLNRELLVYQHELSDEIFDMAVAKLRDVSTNEFSEMLIVAVKGLKGNYTMHLGALSKGKFDYAVLEEVVNTNTGLNITLSPEAIPQKSGFVLADDRVEYDHLFEDLVEDIKSKRTAAVIKEIFGNSSKWMLKV